MATTLHSLQGDEQLAKLVSKEGVNLFGIRHLSPAGAKHLLSFLDDIKPELLLIEFPSDTESLILDITKKGVKPPIAILCYTTEIPVYSISYPLASYSPEYQALLWAKKNKKNCKFIDLPSTVKTYLYRLQEVNNSKIRNSVAENETNELTETLNKELNFLEVQNNLYDNIAKISTEKNYETYWERVFEHSKNYKEYLNGIFIQSSLMREETEILEKEAMPLNFSINTLRESYMKSCIIKAIDSGVKPEKIVAVTGAYHVQGLIENNAMSDEEFESLSKSETKMTIMPYSYYKLSSYSGYGAGNHAPYYYQLMWESMLKNEMEDLSTRYLVKLNAYLRELNGYASTANVIEAERLAKALNFLHKGSFPTLNDLHDSVTTTMGSGNYNEVSIAFAKIDVGTNIGSLPEGVSQTPIQDDLNYQLKRLKLEKYKSVVSQSINLDLRENRKVKSQELAFIDLERSIFFRRLNLLNILFANENHNSQGSATWSEKWVLAWTPEIEISAVESILYGDSIVAAASYVLKEKLDKASNVLDVAKLVRTACDCHLTESIQDALTKLQSLTGESDNFIETAGAGRELSFLIQYANIRKYETDNLVPILKQLFFKATLLLMPSASCNEDTAKKVSESIKLMHYISQEHYETINDELWLTELSKLSHSNEKTPFLCGFATSILLERNYIENEDLYTEVSRHLSSGNTAEAGAGWFEGLTSGNRYVLLSKVFIWEKFDEYLGSLDDESFKTTLVYFRRSFSKFEPSEKNGICEILADIWNLDSANVSEFLQDELSESEQESLDSLNDFDFGDLI